MLLFQIVCFRLVFLVLHLGFTLPCFVATIKTMNINKKELDRFKAFIWDFYTQNRREFPWRNTQDPYAIVVSEIMLQQTQTHRVCDKYLAFMSMFPDFQSLAASSLYDVLSAWQGLGYNRRGKYLHQIASKVVQEFQGILPDSPEILITFPGIGAATASSICAFAFNKPTVFIETNIRAVFIDQFFKDCIDISDKELLPLIAATVDQDNPREWYYALMDYGVFLKQNGKNPNLKSKHYVKQSRFEGSDRQIRGAVIRLLLEKKFLSRSEVYSLRPAADTIRIDVIIDQLVRESFIVDVNNNLSIAINIVR